MSSSGERVETAGQTSWMTFVYRVLSWPRLLRILIVGIASLMLALLIFPVVDSIYFNHFFSPDTRMLSAYVIAAIGLLNYLLGWHLIVGSVGEEKQASRAVLWYLIMMVVTALMLTILIIQGLVIRNTSL